MTDLLRNKRGLKEIDHPPAPENFKISKQSKMAIAITKGKQQSRLAGYSRYVIFMKFVLPLIALVLVASIMIWPQLQVLDETFSIALSDVKLSAKESPNMVNARFVGADLKKQPFSITADIARNLLKETTRIELEMPKADVTLSDGSWLVLTANSGVYNQKGKFLNLDGAVNLFHDSGYEINTKKAYIDLKRGIANSNEPVKGQGPFGHLQAEGFKIEDKGNIILFSGKAKLILFPKALKAN